MKRKSSISHDEAMARELRENPEFAVEYPVRRLRKEMIRRFC